MGFKDGALVSGFARDYALACNYVLPRVLNAIASSVSEEGGGGAAGLPNSVSFLEIRA